MHYSNKLFDLTEYNEIQTELNELISQVEQDNNQNIHCYEVELAKLKIKEACLLLQVWIDHN